MEVLHFYDFTDVYLHHNFHPIGFWNHQHTRTLCYVHPLTPYLSVSMLLSIEFVDVYSFDNNLSIVALSIYGSIEHLK